MPRYAQLVIGPAGSGKSTYCQNVYQHCQSIKRTVHVVNLDPAADHFEYPVSVDIRELISLEDVMEELKLGPNGGLIYCMEYPPFCFLMPRFICLYNAQTSIWT
jgi:GTPase SAR1 family protein